MKIAFNPSTVAALTTPPNNKDITFDLRGRNIFARGVKFYGTDTNTWRDIKINNVSIGSNILDLRNGSNTTLTNINGVVTINSTWRPVVDNLTSDSTTSSLSAKQGKVLKALIDSKSNSDHNHDDRYLKLTGGTMASNALITFADSGSWVTDKGPQGARGGLYWTGQSDYAKLYAEETVGDNLDLVIQFGDDNSNGLSIRNKANTPTSYISAEGVITTGTFKGNLDWSYITNKPSSYTPSAHTHAWNSLTHSSTTENQAILTNGKANGWKLYTLNISRWDNAANNAHSHANKSVLDGITSALVNSWNTAYNFVSNITGTDTDKVINKWEEIVNFLAGITEDNKLNTLLNSKLSVYELADNTNVGTIKNNGIYYSTTDTSSGTLINSPFNTGFAFINMTSYDRGDDLRRSRLAFNAYGDIKVSNDRDQTNTAETWYNVLTSKNSGISGSTIKLNGTSITVYSSGTADGRYVKKSGDTMQGVLTIDTTNFGALTIKRNDDAYGASIQFRGKSSVYGYIGLNNSTKDKQFLRWSSDTSRIYTILDTSSTYISNGKGVINGTTITQVDNATNSTNSTNARKLVNWYSARPTSLNAQFGDGSLRIFYATSYTTEGKPAEDSHILHLAWDNTGGYDAQLAVHIRSGKVSTRAQNGGTWQPWKTLAFITDIPNKDSWNYDDRYLRLTGGWMSGDINFGGDNKIHWGRNTDSASISFKNDGDQDADSYMSFVTSDNGNEYFRWSHISGSTNTEWMALRSDGLRVRGTKVSLEGHSHNDLYYTKAESNAKYITDIATSVNKLTFTRNGSNIARNITVNVVYSQGNLTNIPNKDNTTKASPGLLIYNSYEQTIGTNLYSSVLSINTKGTIQIAGNWGDDQPRNLYWRSQSDRNVVNYPWKSWRTILDSENYSFTLDSRYYTESEVNSLLDAKLNRQNLSYGNWNPRGWNLAADYHYNGGDLSISENNGEMHVLVDGCFWQNEGQYRVLDTSDISGIRDSVTLHQYLSATDVNWYPLVWGGNSHNNTRDSTGSIFKSYDKLSWQTSSQTLYATNIQTNNIKGLPIGGGIYWNPCVESTSDGTDAASITLVRSGVAGGTTLVLSQMNDTNDTIQFQTNTAARLYHNSYPILTTQNTYVNNNKGYINGSEITQVKDSDTVDGWHKNEINRTLYITSSTLGLSSYWAKLWEINLNNQYNDVTITFLAAASYYPSYFSIFSVYLRQNGSGTSKNISARLVELIGNIAIGDTDLRLYVNNTTGNCQLWGNVKGQYGTMNLSVLKKAWRISQDSSNIGTFFLTHFSSVQPLPGDGWYKIGVTQQGAVGVFNPASHTHTWTSITDKIVVGNEFNVVNAGYNNQFWFNYLPINDRNNTATISTYCMGNGKKGVASVTASGFIKNGGNENQLLRADGGVAAFNWAGQSGQPTWLWGGNNFNSYYVYNPSNFNVNTAQYLRSLGNQNCQTGRTQAYGDVYSYNTYVGNTGSPTTNSSVIGFGRGIAGTVEIAGGWCNTHLYWRSLRDCCEDWFPWRTVLDSSNYTEFINNYYWANVKISASSSTTTSPTVSNLTATSSIRMSNISLEHTDEINNSANGVIYLNYRNSGNVSLCFGGGDVGIGTTVPSYKLDVNGQMRARGFHHSSVDSDNYMLLAGGGYKSFGGDDGTPIFLGCLDLYRGGDGTISSSFYCLGYSVPFTYTRGGNYCKIVIPDTTLLSFYIIAAIASVNYSGGGMDTWTGYHRGSGAWWLHCQTFDWNEVRVKGFCQADKNNDSWWGGNPLWNNEYGANKITVCIFGNVKYK